MIHRQRQLLAVSRRLDGGDVFNDVAAAILQYHAAAILAGQHLLARQFHAFLAFAVHAGEADDVGHNLAGRVETAEFLLLGDAGHAQRHYFVGQLRADLALDVNKFFLAVGQFGRQLFRRQIQHRGQFAQLGRRHRLHVRGAGPNRLHRRADRQRLAVAIGDHASVGFQRHCAAEASLALVLQKILLHHLQVNRAADQRQEQQRQHEQHETHAARLHSQRGAGIRDALLMARGVSAHHIPFPGETTWI